MPKIQFPNVPFAAGVPALVRSPSTAPIVTAVFGVLQGAVWRYLYVNKNWGIYQNGKNILDFNGSGVIGELKSSVMGAVTSTVSVTYTKQYRISDYPIEGGGFASYNKVELPSQPIVILAMSGNETERARFLNEIEKLSITTDVYDIVTPEKTYIQHTIESYNYTRTNTKGATLLTVELHLKEVRFVYAAFVDSTSVKTKDAKNANDKPAVSSGKVQGKTDTTALPKVQAKPTYFQWFNSYVKGIIK